jgi:hypothetical protein
VSIGRGWRRRDCYRESVGGPARWSGRAWEEAENAEGFPGNKGVVRGGGLVLARLLAGGLFWIFENPPYDFEASEGRNPRMERP